MSVPLPVQFPSEADHLARITARNQELSAAERFRAFLDLLDTAEMISRASPLREFHRAWATRHEQDGKRRLREFIARHGA